MFVISVVPSCVYSKEKPKKVHQVVLVIIQFSGAIGNIFMKIYCDLDGVLVDLHGKLSQLYGVQLSNGPDFADYFYAFVDKLTKDERIEFWSLLPPTQDCFNLWNHIKNKEPYILTSCSDSIEAMIGKIKWCETNLKISKDRVICVQNSRVKRYFSRKNLILIDDLQSNIVDWNAWGGTGILHKKSEETIRILNSIQNIA